MLLSLDEIFKHLLLRVIDNFRFARFSLKKYRSFVKQGLIDGGLFEPVKDHSLLMADSQLLIRAKLLLLPSLLLWDDLFRLVDCFIHGDDRDG